MRKLLQSFGLLPSDDAIKIAQKITKYNKENPKYKIILKGSSTIAKVKKEPNEP